jgi:hypothetical protein
MASDAIARQYDVDANLNKIIPAKGQKGSYQLGTITFAAKKGKSINLDKIAESIAATRLSGGTNMSVDYLEITVTGKVVEVNNLLVLKVSGTGQELLLSEAPTAKNALKRLRKAEEHGDKVRTVTGLVPGWKGRFPEVLAAWAKAPNTQKRKLAVTGFEVEKK